MPLLSKVPYLSHLQIFISNPRFQHPGKINCSEYCRKGNKNCVFSPLLPQLAAKLLSFLIDVFVGPKNVAGSVAIALCDITKADSLFLHVVTLYERGPGKEMSCFLLSWSSGLIKPSGFFPKCQPPSLVQQVPSLHQRLQSIQRLHAQISASPQQHFFVLQCMGSGMSRVF